MKVSNDFRCTRTLLINDTMESAHYDCERNLSRIGFGGRSTESMAPDVITCKALYQSVIPKYPNLFRAKCVYSITLITCSPISCLTS